MSSAPNVPSHPLLARVLPDLDRIEPRARAAVAGISDAHFRARPPEGGWSMAEIFEHLCVSDGGYVDGRIPTALAKARSRGHQSRPHRPSFFGGMLARMLDEANTKKLPAPRIYRQFTAVRPDVVEQYLAATRRLREQLLAADGLDLGTGLSSLISPLVRLNLGDVFVILVTHAHRHLGQVERTRRAVGA